MKLHNELIYIIFTFTFHVQITDFGSAQQLFDQLPIAIHKNGRQILFWKVWNAQIDNAAQKFGVSKTESQLRYELIQQRTEHVSE